MKSLTNAQFIDGLAANVQDYLAQRARAAVADSLASEDPVSQGLHCLGRLAEELETMRVNVQLLQVPASNRQSQRQVVQAIEWHETALNGFAHFLRQGPERQDAVALLAQADQLFAERASPAP